ncbi:MULTISPECIES: hypothetical protein [unclassified Streptomyces]|uniref:hypothetical protein n=1 Tax=unclassified Streptomyces TaxID=2593676 RepID=UPI002366A121|nr:MULTISPECIES: hypothetical protein [unclassified Streptomyces]MDF3144978.1 hypothetical protein [Streptomyces sp. T21Q-yed]WDF41525.1 hypothetical protein PBV52_34390 [Streptomyces sp. T12]
MGTGTLLNRPRQKRNSRRTRPGSSTASGPSRRERKTRKSCGTGGKKYRTKGVWGKLRSLPESPSFLAGNVSAAERKTAVADITCKRKTDLLETCFETESAIQKAMTKKDAALLHELDELHGKKLSAARKILAKA